MITAVDVSLNFNHALWFENYFHILGSGLRMQTIATGKRASCLAAKRHKRCLIGQSLDSVQDTTRTLAKSTVKAKTSSKIFMQASNCLTGEIPDFLSDSPLAYIDLSHNKLNSTIPDTWLDNPSLQYFAAGFNHLHGEIPGPSLESDLLLKDWGSQSETLPSKTLNLFIFA